DIKSFGDQLVDIRGQHGHHSLLARTSHQRLLDEYGGHRRLAGGAWPRTYAGWRDCRDELDALRASAGERRDRQQLLNYQLGELAELALGANESAALEQEQKRLANTRRTDARRRAGAGAMRGQRGRRWPARGPAPRMRHDASPPWPGERAPTRRVS
ncbi:MAG: hypothetical protein IPF57_09700, partial [Gammaproteobacteria bacterium]|nr:hypothetical protein [Gammaproteobacteria bacterium]